MKKQSNAMLLLMVVAGILFHGCSKSDQVVPTSMQSEVPSGMKSQAHYDRVVITMTYTTLDPNGVWQGTFVTTGSDKLPASGTCTMAVKAHGIGIHCTNTLLTPEGSITMPSYCEFSTDPWKGQWNVKSGTGAYANLKGNGSVQMPESSAGPIEIFSGKIF